MVEIRALQGPLKFFHTSVGKSSVFWQNIHHAQGDCYVGRGLDPVTGHFPHMGVKVRCSSKVYVCKTYTLNIKSSYLSFGLTQNISNGCGYFRKRRS